MIDRRKKMIDKNKYVWLCIHCGRRTIGENKPTSCSCHKGSFVVENNLVVVK